MVPLCYEFGWLRGACTKYQWSLWFFMHKLARKRSKEWDEIRLVNFVQISSRLFFLPEEKGFAGVNDYMHCDCDCDVEIVFVYTDSLDRGSIYLLNFIGIFRFLSVKKGRQIAVGFFPKDEPWHIMIQCIDCQHRNFSSAYKEYA